MSFCADVLSASLAKLDSNATETPLGDVTFRGFALKFTAAKYDMKADVKLMYVVSLWSAL